MSHIGILLASDHYPRVQPNPRHIDGQLRRWFETLGTKIDKVTVFNAFEGDLPDRSRAADVWIVSGTPLAWSHCGRDLKGMLCHFLRGAAASGCPIFGLYHGEHVLHAALACPSDTPPASQPVIRAIRNPFWSFQSRDRLFRYDSTRMTIQHLDRPEVLTPRAMFPQWKRAA